MPRPHVRLIYFPRSYEHRKDPHILYSDGMVCFSNEYRGTPHLEEFLSGKHGFYPASRCQPYTDELWEAVQKWIVARNELENQLQFLMKGKLNHAGSISTRRAQEVPADPVL